MTAKAQNALHENGLLLIDGHFHVDPARIDAASAFVAKLLLAVEEAREAQKFASPYKRKLLGQNIRRGLKDAARFQGEIDAAS